MKNLFRFFERDDRMVFDFFVGDYNSCVLEFILCDDKSLYLSSCQVRSTRTDDLRQATSIVTMLDRLDYSDHNLSGIVNALRAKKYFLAEICDKTVNSDHAIEKNIPENKTYRVNGVLYADVYTVLYGKDVYQFIPAKDERDAVKIFLSENTSMLGYTMLKPIKVKCTRLQNMVDLI